MNNTKKSKIDIELTEEQIYNLKKSVRYDIRELTIEILVKKYEKGLDYDEDEEYSDKFQFYNVVYVPDYQRDFTWDKLRQSRFIESVILGLPIPLIFVAENKDSAWEIVDGSQRIRTLHAFINNKLILNGLDKINTLNNFSFSDLDKSRQGKFLDTPMRMIVLSEDADDEVKRDMFERINRGSDLLKPMEKRKGIYIGYFRDFLYDLCAKDNGREEFNAISTLLTELAPIDKWLENRQEREELLLRYFALSDKNNYLHYPHSTGIANYLDEYLDSKNKELDLAIEKQFGKKYNDFTQQERNDCYKFLYDNYLKPIKIDLENVLQFIKKYSEYGFRKKQNPQTKRVIFEALSVGVHFALKKKPQLTFSRQKMNDIFYSKEFISLTVGNVGNKKAYDPKQVKERVEFIINQILEK
jgi:hypothetical protein